MENLHIWIGEKQSQIVNTNIKLRTNSKSVLNFLFLVHDKKHISLIVSKITI